MLVWLCHVSKSTYFTRFNHSFKIQLTWLVDLWPWLFGAWVELGFNKTPNKLIKFRTSLIFVLTLLLYYLEHISLFIIEEKEFYFWLTILSKPRHSVKASPTNLASTIVLIQWHQHSYILSVFSTVIIFVY